jgi:hypothetical protein
VYRFTLITLAFVSFVVSGCYASHTRPSEDAPPEVVVPPPVCPAESPESAVRYDVLDAEDVTVEAGTRRAQLVVFRLRETIGHDAEFAEYPYRVRAMLGSLTTPDGGAVFTNLRLRVAGRPSGFGPYDVVAGPDEVAEGELWDANILRAGDEAVFTLEADIAEGVEGVYEIRLGDECDLTPRMWFVPEDPPTVEMPTDRIGGNDPITIIVTVVPMGES